MRMFYIVGVAGHHHLSQLSSDKKIALEIPCLSRVLQQGFGAVVLSIRTLVKYGFKLTKLARELLQLFCFCYDNFERWERIPWIPASTPKDNKATSEKKYIRRQL